MACVDKKMNSAEKEQSVDMLMHSIKRWCDHMGKKGICPTCTLDAYMIGLLLFFKEIGHVSPEAALDIFTTCYNRAYEGDAVLMEGIELSPEDVDKLIKETFGERH